MLGLESKENIKKFAYIFYSGNRLSDSNINDIIELSNKLINITGTNTISNKGIENLIKRFLNLMNLKKK